MEFMDMALSDILSLEESTNTKSEEEREEEQQEGAYILLEESLIARIARDILRALTRIHRLNRIHRDIRSDNILLNLRGDVKLSKCLLSLHRIGKEYSMTNLQYEYNS